LQKELPLLDQFVHLAAQHCILVRTFIFLRSGGGGGPSMNAFV